MPDSVAISNRHINYHLSDHRKDPLIAWMKELLHHAFVLNVMETQVILDILDFFESLFDEHHRQPQGSRLSFVVPGIGQFFCPLPIKMAFKIYDAKYCLTRRSHVTPTFNEIRHVLNIAQIISTSKTGLKMITFDGVSVALL